MTRLISACWKEVTFTPELVPAAATIWPVVSTVTLLPKLRIVADGQRRFVPLIVKVEIVCEVALAPVLTVS